MKSNVEDSVKKKPYIKVLLGLLIILLLFLTLSRFDGWDLLHSIKQIPLWSLPLLLCLQLISQLLVNLQWYKIAKFANASITFRDMFYINSQGAVVDSITPGVKFGGEVTRGVQISRIGNCSGGQAAAVVAVQKLFSLSAFVLISLFAVSRIIVFSPFLEAAHLQFLVYGILAIFLLLFACFFFMPQRMKAYLLVRKNPRFSWALRVKNFFLTMLDQVISIRKDSKTCLMLFLLSFLIWLIYPLKMYLLAVQVFPGVNIIYIGAVTFVSYMVAMLPIFPGGLGGFEGAMTGLLLVMGFTQSDAFVITILFRFVTFWFVMLLSAAFIVFYKLRYSSGFYAS